MVHSLSKYSKTIKKTTMTHTMLWEKGCRGEMLRLYFKLRPKCQPTDSLYYSNMIMI